VLSETNNVPGIKCSNRKKNNLRIMVYTMEKQKRMNLEFIKQQSNCHVWYDCWHMQTDQKSKTKSILT